MGCAPVCESHCSSNWCAVHLPVNHIAPPTDALCTCQWITLLLQLLRCAPASESHCSSSWCAVHLPVNHIAPLTEALCTCQWIPFLLQLMHCAVCTCQWITLLINWCAVLLLVNSHWLPPEAMCICHWSHIALSTKALCTCQSSTLFPQFKGIQDWDFFWLRFWNLYYFFISYVKILRFYKKIFIRPLLGEIRFFRLVWD
jgi:hypothetical protein